LRPILLLSRPEPQSLRFADLCIDRFGDVFDIIISPVLDIKHLPLRCSIPPETSLIFSSENAVHAIAGQITGSGQCAYCVGDRTADMARDAGFTAISAQGSAYDLIERISADSPSNALVYLHGNITRVDIAKALREKGLNISANLVYDQVPRPLTFDAETALLGATPVLIPLFSPRSAALMANHAKTAKAPLFIAAFSEAVAQEWLAPKQGIRISKRPDVTEMLNVLSLTYDDCVP